MSASVDNLKLSQWHVLLEVFGIGRIHEIVLITRHDCDFGNRFVDLLQLGRRDSMCDDLA